MGGDENSVEDPFFEQCSQFYQTITSLSNDIAKYTYKGFVEVGENMIIAVFDHTQHADDQTDPTKPKIPLHTAIIDEIVNHKKVVDTPINENVSTTFAEHPILQYILDEETGQGIDIPIVAYLCKEAPNNDYDNVFYESEEEKQGEHSVVQESIFHDVLGTTNLFSREPLEQTNLSLIKRFATFTQNTVYLLNKEIPLIEYSHIKEKLSIFFWENENEFISVKTTDLFVEL
jgi:hypothetical protein